MLRSSDSRVGSNLGLEAARLMLLDLCPGGVGVEWHEGTAYLHLSCQRLLSLSSQTVGLNRSCLTDEDFKIPLLLKQLCARGLRLINRQLLF